MNYEIRKVANGFVVFPAMSLGNHNYAAASDMHVFQTWERASDWLREKFSQGSSE